MQEIEAILQSIAESTFWPLPTEALEMPVGRWIPQGGSSKNAAQIIGAWLEEEWPLAEADAADLEGVTVMSSFRVVSFVGDGLGVVALLAFRPLSPRNGTISWGIHMRYNSKTSVWEEFESNDDGYLALEKQACT